MNGAAVAVAEHLDLDMTRRLQIFLEIERVVAERRLGFGARGRQGRSQFRLRARHLHAPPAAAGRRLDQQRKPEVRRQPGGLLLGSDGRFRARHHRKPEPFGGALGLDLVAHQPDVLGLGPDEMHIVLGENLGEPGVLGQKAVARVHRIRAGDLAGGEQRGNVQVGILGRRRTDADALVGEPHVHGVVVGGRMHGHGGDAELLASAQNSERDLAAVGDEDLIEHDLAAMLALPGRGLAAAHSMIISGWPYSTGWPSSNRICMTVPAFGAGI